jgi:hypothetical protein
MIGRGAIRGMRPRSASGSSIPTTAVDLLVPLPPLPGDIQSLPRASKRMKARLPSVA